MWGQMSVASVKETRVGFVPSPPLSTEFHIIIALSVSIMGSVLCGTGALKIFEFILMHHFSTMLANVILCLSLVYMTFYIGKAPKTPGVVASMVNVHSWILWLDRL